MKRKSLIFIAVYLIFLLLAFPLFYFVYKFLDPKEVAHDFFQYYRLYNNWDWQNVNAPFNMRLISSFLVFLFSKMGIYYETTSAFDQYLGYGFDKSVYFSAIFFNYLCVAMSATVIVFTVKKFFKDPGLAFVSGLIFLLGFGTLFFELVPSTDSFSVLLFAVTLVLYLTENKWVILILAFSVLQREYILLAFGLLALVDGLHRRQSYYLYVMLASLILFVCYFYLRRTFFHTPALSFQTSPQVLVESLLVKNFPIRPFIRQTLMSMNIFILYLLLIGYKKIRSENFDKIAITKMGLLFAQVTLISFAAVLGNNTGRYFYILTPLLVFELARESQFLLRQGA